MRKKEKQSKNTKQQEEQVQLDVPAFFGEESLLTGCSDNLFDDDFFTTIPEGTRIFIEGNTVTFENMTPELEDVAHSLNPESGHGEGEKKRRKSRKKADKY